MSSDLCQDGHIRITTGEDQESDVPIDGDRDRRGAQDFINLTDVPNEGRVEVCFQNVWGAVYDQNWTNKDAAVACYQLGFSRYGTCMICYYRM